MSDEISGALVSVRIRSEQKKSHTVFARRHQFELGQPITFDREDPEVSSIEGLAGKTVAFGAKDSPQARLIPQGLLIRHGLMPGKDYTEKRFDLLVGKHGDHIGGEKEAFACLKGGEAQATCMIDLNWEAWTKDGTVDPGGFEILATTDRYDHCVFTVREDFPADLQERWLKVLHLMSYDGPIHREMMDMEGLKKWEPGRTEGFAALTEAVEKLTVYENA